MQTARAIENWSLAAVPRELHCSKTSSGSKHLQYKEGLARKQA
jgi:hypothetical protein